MKKYRSKLAKNTENMTIIESKPGLEFVNLKELLEYRDLFSFLIWRDLKIMYAQTILGFAWAVLEPLIQIAIFTIIFGKVAKLSTEGIPYILYSSVAIIPWTYISQAVTNSSQSLISGQSMLGKVYFPRLLFPLTPILSKLVNFGISIIIICFILIYFRVLPTWNMMLFPFLILLMICIAFGTGLWLSAMAIRFRDIRFAMTFVVRMAMYSAPIVYSASSIPESYRIIYSINPIVSLIEGFRACFLGTPIPWMYILPGTLTAAVLLISGIFYFKHLERLFVDVI